jgi:hypothetical protein
MVTEHLIDFFKIMIVHVTSSIYDEIKLSWSNGGFPMG